MSCIFLNVAHQNRPDPCKRFRLQGHVGLGLHEPQTKLLVSPV